MVEMVGVTEQAGMQSPPVIEGRWAERSWLIYPKWHSCTLASVKVFAPLQRKTIWELKLALQKSAKAKCWSHSSWWNADVGLGAEAVCPCHSTAATSGLGLQPLDAQERGWCIPTRLLNPEQGWRPSSLHTPHLGGCSYSQQEARSGSGTGLCYPQSCSLQTSTARRLMPLA